MRQAASTLAVQTRGAGLLEITREVAGWAAEQGRTVFALMTDYNRRGAHVMRDLIADGAHAVSDIFDIWSVYNTDYGITPAPEAIERAKQLVYGPPRPAQSPKSYPPDRAGAKEPPPPAAAYKLPENLDPVAVKVYEAFRRDTASHIDDIAQTTGVPVREVSAALTLLELEGAVTCLPGRHYKAN